MPKYKRSTRSAIMGMRKRYVSNLTPSTVNPEETLVVDIPKLKPSSCLVPGTLNLVFDFEVTGTKSWFHNNLSKLLCSRLEITLGGDVVYSNTGESHLGVYRDMWRTNACRSDSVIFGIGSENMRKLICKDDTGTSSGGESNRLDGLVHKIIDSTQRISLGKILEDHGMYAPFYLQNNFRYAITFPHSREFMKAQSGESIGDYKLENLRIEYESIENIEIAKEISMMYSGGRSMNFEEAQLLETKPWSKTLTITSEKVNIPRKSMKAIVMLFTKSPDILESEDFVFPNINKVSVDIEGTPNVIYSKGMMRDRLYYEAKRLFQVGGDVDSFMTIGRFFDTGFALVIDLRTIEDTSKTSDGTRLVNTQAGVSVIVEKGSTTTDLTCRIYALSDGLVDFQNLSVSNIQR